MSRVKRFIYFILIQIFAVGLDQYTKFLAEKYLISKDYPIIKNILELVYAQNMGAAFGILQGATYFFYIVGLIVAILLIRYIYVMPDTKKMIPIFICFCFIFAGALSNILDRIFRAYVVDFIYFKPINFPIFNVADIYVSCASALMIYLLFFYYKEEELKFLSYDKKKD